jgi:hypothetical protein
MIAEEGGHKTTVGCHDLHAVILPVGDIEVAIFVYSYIARTVKLADAIAGDPATESGIASA